jgi:hypothetical protein
MRNSQWKIGVAVMGLRDMRATQSGLELRVPVTCYLYPILCDPETNLVYIASSNETHCELAKKSLRPEKAVLCEKLNALRVPFRISKLPKRISFGTHCKTTRQVGAQKQIQNSKDL